MEEIAILSCTNRPDSYTLRVCAIYDRILRNLGTSSRTLDFRDLPPDIAFTETFGHRSPAYATFLQEHLGGINRLIFVIPEYNGSFPGLLKVFIDSIHPREWAEKRVCLVGVADGRGGNIRGLEHITGILHYLKIHVYHNKLPISLVVKQMDAQGNFNPEQMKACETQVQGFMNF